MDRNLRRIGGRMVRLGLLLMSGLGTVGCAAFTNPTANESIPVNRLPPEVFGRPREEEKTIPLTLLRIKPTDSYQLDAGDVLGVYIESVLGERNQIPPVINFTTPGVEQGLPPAVGFPIPVQENGTLTLPLIDPIPVKGKAILEVQDLIRDAYIKGGLIEKGKDRIIVTLARKRTYPVTVVRQDGGGVLVGAGGQLTNSRRGTGITLELPAGENDVLTALARSGGLPGLDASNRVVIQRVSALNENVQSMNVGQISAETSQVVIPLRMRQNDSLPFKPEDTVLRKGDIVFIESRDTEVYYTGGLLPVGEFVLPRDYDLDVMEAVVQCRGPLFNGGINYNNLGGNIYSPGIGFPSPSLLVVLRKTPNCGQIAIRVDLNRAAQDPRERILVKPGDFLILQETPYEAFTRYATSTFRIGFFGTFARQRDMLISTTTTLP